MGPGGAGLSLWASVRVTESEASCRCFSCGKDQVTVLIEPNLRAKHVALHPESLRELTAFLLSPQSLILIRVS